MNYNDLINRQSLPLEQKIILSQMKIKSWYDYFEGDVYVSFSGGKDSTVLLDIVRNTPGVYDVPAVFVDTGLEYPEVRVFGRKLADTILYPNMTFKNVIDAYGYPVISKEQSNYINEARNSTPKMRELRINGRNGRFKISGKHMYLLDAPFEVSGKCCDVMKKRPFKSYEQKTGRKPYIGTMACESSLRKQLYIRNGCNSFDSKRQISTPIGFWTEQDILEYIKTRDLDYAGVYGEIIEDENGKLSTTGVERTGCMFCMFGVNYDEHPNRFERMKITHPKQYRYCIEDLGLNRVLDYIGVSY